MATAIIKIENRKYRLMPEQDYQTIMNDIKDWKKILKRADEDGMEARAFFEKASKSKRKPE